MCVDGRKLGALPGRECLGGGSHQRSRVVLGVWAGHERPPGNLRILAGLRHPRHVVVRHPRKLTTPSLIGESGNVIAGTSPTLLGLLRETRAGLHISAR